MKQVRSVRNLRIPQAFTALAAYGSAVIVCLLILVWVLKLRDADFSLSIPFVYRVDGMFNAALIKGLIQNGWYLTNGHMGYPGSLTLYDFPMADSLHFLLIKIIALFSENFAVVMNLYYLATFPLATMAALFVFRRMKISYPVAVLGSLLFTFIPYHELRGEGHLFLAGYYIVPLSALALLRFFYGSPPFFRSDGRCCAPDFISLRSAGYVLIALLTASAGVYYAVFALFLMVVAGAYAAGNRRAWQPLLAAGLMIGLVVIGIVVNLAPGLLYQRSHGGNEITVRAPLESYVFAGTITQMLLPTWGHRVDFLREMKTDYFQQLNAQVVSDPPIASMINENDSASLGLIGSMGLLFSLGWLILVRGRLPEENQRFYQLFDATAVLNLAAILLATIGGFGLLFSFLITPQIRSYNRISVYIAFFSILTVLVLIERLRQKYAGSRRYSLMILGAVPVLLAVGIFDQTTASMVPVYSQIKDAFTRDETYFREVESSMPPGAHVFQLPYVAFPESDPGLQRDYEHFRAYLHTDDMYWSYGAIKGRETADWQKATAAQPVTLMVRDLAAAGFNGVYLNRAGYADSGAELEQQLTEVLQASPLRNGDDTLLFFDMTGYQQRVDNVGRTSE